MKRVYIETTIPSFYYEVRTEPEMVARRNWTRTWWNKHAEAYELVTSEPVIDELTQGDFPNRDQMLALLADIPQVPVETETTEIIRYYIDHHVMPADPVGDALHLALAAMHKCDYLLTWNCRHLANPNKFNHIRLTHTVLGLYNPMLVTPLALLGGQSDE